MREHHTSKAAKISYGTSTVCTTATDHNFKNCRARIQTKKRWWIDFKKWIDPLILILIYIDFHWLILQLYIRIHIIWYGGLQGNPPTRSNESWFSIFYIQHPTNERTNDGWQIQYRYRVPTPIDESAPWSMDLAPSLSLP